MTDWMSKWGQIPATYGSSGVATAHPGEGLTILYDDHCGWPVIYDARSGWPVSDASGAYSYTPIRCDQYGRALPIAPKLPVSTGLIYFGDVM